MRNRRLSQLFSVVTSIVVMGLVISVMMSPHLVEAQTVVPPNIGSGQGWWHRYPLGAYTWNSDPSWWKSILHVNATTETGGIQIIANLVLGILSSTVFDAIALYKSLIQPDWIMAPLIQAISGIFQKAVGPIVGALLPILFVVAMGVLVYRYMQGRFRAVWMGLLQMVISLLIVGVTIMNFAGTFWVIDHTLNGFTDYVGTITANAMDSGAGGMFDGIWTSYVLEPWEFGQFGFWSPNTTDINMTPFAQNFLARQDRSVTADNWIPYTLGAVNKVTATNDYINAQNTGDAAATGEPANVVSAYQSGITPPTTAAQGLDVVFLALVAAIPAIAFLFAVGYQSFVRELFFVKTLLMGVFAIPVSFVPEYGFSSLWRWIKMAMGHWMVRTGVVLYATLTMALGVVIGTAVANSTQQISVFSVMDGTGGAGGQGEGALGFTVILTSLLYLASLLFGLPKVNRFLRSAEQKLVLSHAHHDENISRGAEAEHSASGRANAGHPDQTVVAPPEPPKHHHHLVRDAAIVGGSVVAAVATGGASLAVEGVAAAGAAVGAEAVGAGMATAAVGETAASVATSEAVVTEAANVTASEMAVTEAPVDALSTTNALKKRPKNIIRGVHGVTRKKDHAEEQEVSISHTEAPAVALSPTPPTTIPSAGGNVSAPVSPAPELPSTTVSPTVTSPPTPTTDKGPSVTEGIHAPTNILPPQASTTFAPPSSVPLTEISGSTRQETRQDTKQETNPPTSSADTATGWRSLMPRQVENRLAKMKHIATNPHLWLDKSEKMAVDTTLPPSQEFWDRRAEQGMSQAQLVEDLPKRAIAALIKKAVHPDQAPESKQTSTPHDPPPPSVEPKETEQKASQEDAWTQQLSAALARMEKGQTKQMGEMAKRLEEQQKAQAVQASMQTKMIETLNPKASFDALTEVLKELKDQVEVLKETPVDKRDSTATAESLQLLAASIARQVNPAWQPPQPVPPPEKVNTPPTTTP